MAQKTGGKKSNITYDAMLKSMLNVTIYQKEWIRPPHR